MNSSQEVKIVLRLTASAVNGDPYELNVKSASYALTACAVAFVTCAEDDPSPTHTYLKP
jgi:hypothetical protein